MQPSPSVTVSKAERLFPPAHPGPERAVPLSLLDATAAEFQLTNAIWLFDAPASGADPVPRLRASLVATLGHYPQWCGRLKSIRSTDGTGGSEIDAFGFPPHARRFGRVYVHYGTARDPGVEFITAESTAALGEIYPRRRTAEQPLWNRHDVALGEFAAATGIASALSPDEAGEDGPLKPAMAVQVTRLACGGFVLAAKIAHPLADIASLMYFVKHWAHNSRQELGQEGTEGRWPSPLFDPTLLDARAAGDINTEERDDNLMKKHSPFPFHRYDWWAMSPDRPMPEKIPDVFQGKDIPPAGIPIPWAEWDMKAPVSNYTIHFDHHQVQQLHREATADSGPQLSTHDALLAHIWSCIARARNLHEDARPIHCDLTYGVRPALRLPASFLGSAGVMTNIELPAETVSSADALQRVAAHIRVAVARVGTEEGLAAHLHGVAHEASPPRLWQGFLGRRHTMVTTWARAGVYGVDFGAGRARFADAVLPDLDGLVVISEAPPAGGEEGGGKGPWTKDGVDVSVRLRSEDMERLLEDSLLLPPQSRIQRQRSIPSITYIAVTTKI